MTRLERNRHEALAIVTRIERNLEIESIVRASSLIRAGLLSKEELQSLYAQVSAPTETFETFNRPRKNRKGAF